MVRRRPVRSGLEVPSWVATYEAGAAWPSGVREWREAVRAYCHRTQLAHSDAELWLQVVANTHTTRMRLLKGERYSPKV